jgi:hypothetical protein
MELIVWRFGTKSGPRWLPREWCPGEDQLVPCHTATTFGPDDQFSSPGSSSNTAARNVKYACATSAWYG